MSKQTLNFSQGSHQKPNLWAVQRNFLFIFFFVALTQIPFSSFAKGKEIPVESGRSVRQQVDTYAEFVEKEMILAKNNKERFRILKKIAGKFQGLLNKNSELSAEDQAYIQVVLKGFKELPLEKGFKKKNCSTYKAKFLSQFEPTPQAEVVPTDPALKSSWSSLNALCK
jgi:hypothetical protein